MDLMKTSSNAVKILDDHKDILLLAGGLTAGAGAIVCSSRATLKAKNIIETHKWVRNDIEEAAEIDKVYAENDKKKDIRELYIGTGVSLAKAYTPAVVLGGAAAACIIGEHCVMQNRVNNLEKTVAGLGAAYVAIDNAFKAYRKRVIDKYGKEEDRRLRFGIEETVVEEVDEKGKKKKVKKEFAGEFNKDEFIIFFNGDQPIFMWKDPMKYNADWDANIRVLLGVQSFLQRKLDVEGKVYWNDLLSELGMKKTDNGQIVGWKEGSIIDLGINKAINRRLIDGTEEECMILEPNIDGIIVDLNNIK